MYKGAQLLVAYSKLVVKLRSENGHPSLDLTFTQQESNILLWLDNKIPY